MESKRNPASARLNKIKGRCEGDSNLDAEPIMTRMMRCSGVKSIGLDTGGGQM